MNVKNNFMPLTTKQKEVIKKMRNGFTLYENKITPGARWTLITDTCYRWGNVSGQVILKLLQSDLITGERHHTGCFKYQLTELGKTIQL